MPSFFHRTTALCTSLIAVGLLAACASTTPSPALEEARTAVSTAAGDPAVNQYAQLELKQATDALAKADRVWADDRDTSETNHLAYLARQRAEIATNAARARQLDANIQQAGSEADRIRLQARTQEADAARLRAQQAQQPAMSAEQRAALDLDSLLESVVEDAAESGHDAVLEQGSGAVLMLRPLAMRRLFLEMNCALSRPVRPAPSVASRLNVTSCTAWS